MISIRSAILAVLVTSLACACGDESSPNQPLQDPDATASEDADRIDMATPIDMGDSDLGPDAGAADTPPFWAAGDMLAAQPNGANSALLSWPMASDDNRVAAYEVYRETTRVALLPGSQTTYEIDGLSETDATMIELVALDELAQSSAPLSVSYVARIPAPEEVAPVRDTTSVTPFVDSLQHIWQGENPPQRDVAPAALDEDRITMITGVLIDSDDQPISDVHIRVHGEAAQGWTRSREDGRFQFVANGGGRVTLHFERDGYMQVQRSLHTQWHELNSVGPIVLLPYDNEVTMIDPSMPVAVHQSTPHDDGDGERRVTMLFRQGTTASMVFANGTEMNLDPPFAVRATEYTVGENAVTAMPGTLPPTSQMMFAANLTLDRAEQAGAETVRFSQPVTYYVENFTGFPVGEVTPVGYYDFERARWIPEDNGNIVEIVDIRNGRAYLDLDGDGNEDDESIYPALDFTDAEMQELADLFAVGDQLWRQQTTHFSPRDLNWMQGCPATGCQPVNLKNRDKSIFRDDCAFGSILQCRDRVLRETMPIAGSTSALNFSTRFQDGYIAKRAVVPESLPSISTPIEEGILLFSSDIQRTNRFDPTDKFEALVWDGELFGRGDYNGGVVAKLQTYSCYNLLLGGPNAAEPLNRTNVSAFANFVTPRDSVLGIPSNRTFGSQGICVVEPFGLVGLQPQIMAATEAFALPLEGWDVPLELLGGWTLSDHHQYDPNIEFLYEGNGSARQVRPLGQGVQTFLNEWRFMGVSPSPRVQLLSALDFRPSDIDDLDVAEDGTVYFVESFFNRVVEVRDGRVRPFAGTYESTQNGFKLEGFNGDGILGSLALLDGPTSVAVGDDGWVYIADKDNGRIRRVNRETRMIETFAGGGDPAADQTAGMPALDAHIEAKAISFGPDGVLYIAEEGCIRRISLRGMISVIAGDCQTTSMSGVGASALDSTIAVEDLVLSSEGRLYFVNNEGVYRITRMGVLEEVFVEDPSADENASGESVDFRKLERIELDANDVIYLGDERRVMRLEQGSVETVMGACITDLGECDFATAVSYDPIGRLPTNTRLPSGQTVTPAFAPDGDLLVAHWRQIQRIGNIGDEDEGETKVPSSDGSEIYRFDETGRHLATISLPSGVVTRTFDYDAAGRLIRVHDEHGLHLEVVRDSQGRPTKLRTEGGIETTLRLHPDGRLREIEDPENRVWTLGYDDKGLLSRFMLPTGAQTTFVYDEFGFLVEENGPSNHSQGLELLEPTSMQAQVVRLTTAEGVTREFGQLAFELDTRREIFEQLADGERIVREPVDETTSVFKYPDGSQKFVTLAADPRFANGSVMYASKVRWRTPGGKNLQSQVAKTVELGDPLDPTTITRSTITTRNEGQTFVSEWDAMSRTRVDTTPLGRTSTVELDALNRVVSLSNSARATATFTWDEERLASSTIGDREVAYAYDSNGFQTSRTDSDLTSGTSYTTQFSRDSLGRIIRTDRPDGVSVATTYTAHGAPGSIQVGSRNAVQFEYDGSGLPTRIIHPDGSSRITTYDADSRLKETTREDGTKTELVYVDNRLSEMKSGVRFVRFEYDTLGQISRTETDDGNVVTTTSDGFILESETWSGDVNGSYTHRYNNAGRKASTQVGSYFIGYGYNLDGLTGTVGQMQITRSPLNLDITNTTLTNGLTSSHIYDDRGRRLSDDFRVAGATSYELQQSYNAFSQVTSRTEIYRGTTRNQTFDYDAVGRLAAVTVDGQTTTYAYDDNGNRTSITTPQRTINVTYDDRDRIQTLGTRSYTWNANGELTTVTDSSTGDSTTYEWHPLGMLEAVNLPDGRRITYSYDARGRRIAKYIDGLAARQWIYKDQWNPLAEYDGSGNLRWVFVYSTRPHVPSHIIEAATGTRYRLILDPIGSVRAVADASSNFVQERTYSVDGEVLSDTNPLGQPFGFAGGLYDPDTGLTHFGARDYDPVSARFITPEPLGYRAGSTNLYHYAWGDPVNWIDPNGHNPIFVPILVGALLSIAIDSLTQYAVKGCINLWQVGIAGVLGGLGSGASAFLSKALTAGISSRLLATEFILSFEGKIAAAGVQRMLESSVRTLALQKAGIEIATNAALGAAGGFLQTEFNNVLNTATGRANPSSPFDGAGSSASTAALAGGFAALLGASPSLGRAVGGIRAPNIGPTVSLIGTSVVERITPAGWQSAFEE